MTQTTFDYKKAANELYRALLVSLPYVEVDSCDLSQELASELRNVRDRYEDIFNVTS